MVRAVERRDAPALVVVTAYLPAMVERMAMVAGRLAARIRAVVMEQVTLAWATEQVILVLAQSWLDCWEWVIRRSSGSLVLGAQYL